jgi:hypothetical protein
MHALWCFHDTPGAVTVTATTRVETRATSPTNPASSQDDAADATWYDVGALPSLAFDHKLIMREAFEQLAGRPEVQAAGVCLLDDGAVTGGAAASCFVLLVARRRASCYCCSDGCVEVRGLSPGDGTVLVGGKRAAALLVRCCGCRRHAAAAGGRRTTPAGPVDTANGVRLARRE